MSHKAIGGHQQHTGKSQVWLTPPHVIQALGQFDLDPCAAPEPRPWNTAKRMITLPCDGLSMPWEPNARVWMNPPYDQAEVWQWFDRLAEHNYGTALLFARTETEGFHKYIWQRAEAALFLEGRLFFHYPDGTRAKANGGAPSVLVAYGAEDADALRGCGLKGQFVPIAPTAALFVFSRAAEGVLDESWRDVVAAHLRAPRSLAELYARIDGHPKTRSNENWRAKIRQTLQRMGAARLDTGEYVAA